MIAPGELFARAGGEAGLRRIVDRFYDLMDSRPEVAPLRRLHPEDLTESRDKLFLFLVGWTGGPPVYVQKFGHPRLRARHLPFSIGAAERDQWLACMRQALAELVEDAEVRTYLDEKLTPLADHMRNRPEQP